MSKRKKTKQVSAFQPLIIGIAAGISAAALAAALISLLLVKKDIPISQVKYLWLVIAIVSGIVSGFTAVRYIKNKGFFWGAVSAGLTSLVILSVVIAINSMHISSFIFAIIPTQLVSGAIGGIISTNTRK